VTGTLLDAEDALATREEEGETDPCVPAPQLPIVFAPVSPEVERQKVTVDPRLPPATVELSVAPEAVTELAASVAAVGAITVVVKFRIEP
jgi:hypothetical protein